MIVARVVTELTPQKVKEYEDIKKIYRESDVLLMPGYGGYFIMAYLEAFSYGLPIIALDTYGVSEFVIPGKTGFTVKPSANAPVNVPEYPANTRSKKFIEMIKEKDPKVINDLVNKCELIIKSPELLKKMSVESQEDFSNKSLSSNPSQCRVITPAPAFM